MAHRLVLVRHARLEAAHVGRLVGATDPPLDAAGLRQAAALAPRIRRLAPRRCFCSPLGRCRQTAAAIAGDLEIEIDPALREIDFGRWEDRRFDDLKVEEPALVDRWAAFEFDFAFPGGESLRGFLERVQAAADRMAHDPADTVLAVTHGGAIRAIICHLLGLDPRNYVLFEVEYAAAVVLEVFDGRGVLVFPGAEADCPDFRGHARENGTVPFRSRGGAETPGDAGHG
jgi:alpha-ribazole phosphatase